jgi:pentapeptide MXKDX repeat protein
MRDDDASVVGAKQSRLISTGHRRASEASAEISFSDEPRRPTNNTPGVAMKRIAIAAVAAAFLISGGSAFAQASGAMSNDSMSKDAMSKDSMSKDSMSKNSMSKDAMKKDGGKMKPDAMKKDDAMSK